MRSGLLLAILLAGGPAYAQVQGVTSGYAIDTRSGSIQPVLGIPGAARLGDPSVLPSAAGEGVVANGRAVMISARRVRVLVVQNLSSPAPAVIPLSGVIPDVSRVFLNGNATTALLYSDKRRLFQFITGVDSTPVVGDSFAASLLRGAFSAAAVAGSRPCALFASFDPANSYIQQACADSPGSVLDVAQLPAVRAAAISLSRQDQDALVADQAGNQILLLPDFAQGAGPIAVAGPAQGIDSPVAVLALGPTTFAAIDGVSPKLVLADSANPAAARTIALPAVPTQLEFLDPSGVLSCTRIGPGPLLLVDARQDFAPFFVPIN
jgi:hypothetical protein